jgi:hypothetical protein
MKRYQIKFTQEAGEDYKRLLYVINEKYKAPLTAKKYTTELINEVYKLKSSAESFPFCGQQSVISKYGYNARRINYKKMAIIYTVFPI